MKAAILVLLGLAAVSSWFAARSATSGIQEPRAHAAPNVLLRADDGTAIRLTRQAAPTIVVFGYAGCADICPLTLRAVSRAIAESSYRRKPRVLFVDVDPGTDSADVVRRFVGHFPGVRGIVGDARNVAALESALDLAPTVRRGSALDHDGRVFVLDRSGTLLGTLAPGASVPAIRSSLRTMLRQVDG
jgi:cytochrome oxidase Cu insertion factor (SCO1/SenC/PrrC family)